jgi:hypothetical protein
MVEGPVDIFQMSLFAWSISAQQLKGKVILSRRHPNHGIAMDSELVALMTRLPPL